MQKRPFEIEFKVRDYECDLQGIVNNSVYQNYLEHARHEYLHQVGIHFAELAKKGIFLVLTRAELDYKLPLKSGDGCRVSVEAFRFGRLRGVFQQTITRLSDNKSSVEGHAYCATINDQGKPIRPEPIASWLDGLQEFSPKN